MSKFKVGDRVRATRNCSASVRGQVYELELTNEGLQLKGTNCNCGEGWELVEEALVIKTNKIMSKVKDFVKNLALSADEKLLRKHGFKSDCGDYTSEAIEALQAKLAKDNEAYFIELAKGLEAEEK